MKKLAEFITKHKNIIILLAVILLIPSGIGYVSTRVNYDILSYLPDSLETVKGQDVMVDEFGMGAFSMIVVEDMSMKDAAALEKKIEAIDHVEDVLWYDDALDISVPTKMMPDKLRKAFFNGDATMMNALCFYDSPNLLHKYHSTHPLYLLPIELTIFLHTLPFFLYALLHSPKNVQSL